METVNTKTNIKVLVKHKDGTDNKGFLIAVDYTLWFKKNAPTLADYHYDPVQSILIIFSRLFVNDHKSCLVVKPHICCHYTL